MDILLEILKNLGLAAGGGFSGWYFTKRQYNATAAVTEGTALATMQSSYKTFVEDSNARFEEMRAEISSLHLDIKQLSSELENCKKQYIN